MSDDLKPLIVVCGEALVDLFVHPQPNGALDVNARLAGAPFNLAIGIARLGGHAALAAGLSSDMFGQSIITQLHAEHVDTDFIETYDAPTNLVIVGRNAKDEPTYDFPVQGSADRKLQLLRLHDTSRQISAITLGSYLIAFPESRKALLAVISKKRDASLICLDPNVRLGMIADCQIWKDAFETFAPLCDIIKASEEDIDAIYPGRDHDRIAKQILNQGPKLVIITRGRDGVSAWHKNGTTVSLESHKVLVKDTVGAGDSFFAALLMHLQGHDALHKDRLSDLSREALLAALSFANRAAAITCSRFGADLPRQSDLASGSI